MHIAQTLDQISFNFPDAPDSATVLQFQMQVFLL